MSEYIFDPVESLMLEFLDTAIAEPAYSQLPKTLPSKFVQVNAVGGSEGVVTQHPMVTFTCWDQSRGKAGRFASVVMARLKACRMLGSLPVYKVSTVGLPVERPDESGMKRFQFTLMFKIRGRSFTP